MRHSIVSHEEWLKAASTLVNGAHQFLDLTPKGRDENGFKLSMEWVRRHDQY